jgi:hypothetical protein
MPDKYMLCDDNIRELSRHSRLTAEVPFISLHSHDCGIGALTRAGMLYTHSGTKKPAVSEQDAIQMIRQGCKRGAVRALAAKRQVRYAAVVVLAVVSAACATLGPDSPNEQRSRSCRAGAGARDAIIGKDFAAAYGYMSPTSRATMTEAGFKTIASRLSYRAAEVKEAKCDAGNCRLKLIITYDMPTMKGIHSPLEENWVIDRGQIWYVWPL